MTAAAVKVLNARLGPLFVWQLLAIVVVGLTAWGGTVDNGWTYDDPMVIRDAQPFLSRADVTELFKPTYFRAAREGTWRPMVTASYMLDYHFSSLKLRGYHVQCIAWHLLVSVLVAALAAQLLAEKERAFAVVAGLFYAAHPLASEAVENVSFREDLLACAFMLLALLLALRRTRVSLALAALAWLLALLSKESAFVLPGLLLAVGLVKAREGRRVVTLAEGLLFGLVAVGWLAVRFGPMAGPPNYAAFAGGTRLDTLLTMPRVLVHYLRLVVVPWPLIADYSGAFDFGPLSGDRLAALLVVPGCGAALFFLWRLSRLAAVGLGWFLIALAPVSNVMATPIFAAERFLYLPLVGPALAASALAVLAASRPLLQRRAALALFVAALAAGVALCNRRHLAWKSNLSLWLDVAEHNPRSYRAHANVAIELMDVEPRVATAELENSLRLCPWVAGREDVDNLLCSSNANKLGELRLKQNELDKAEAAFKKSLEIRLSNPDPVAGLREVARRRAALER